AGDVAQGLVGEHHSEPVGGVGRIALVDRDLDLGHGQAGQDGGVETGRSAADADDAVHGGDGRGAWPGFPRRRSLGDPRTVSDESKEQAWRTVTPPTCTSPTTISTGPGRSPAACSGGPSTPRPASRTTRGGKLRTRSATAD